MRTRTISAFVFALTLSFAPIAGAQDQPDAEKNRQNYETAFNAGNAADVAKLFAEDAVVMEAGADRVEGRSAIESHYGAAFEKAKPADLKITSAESRLIGEVFVDSGTYRMTVTGPDGQARPVQGDYLALLEKGSGDEWLITRLISNQDLPQAPR